MIPEAKGSRIKAESDEDALIHRPFLLHPHKIEGGGGLSQA